MNENKKQKKVVILALAGLLIGSLLFIFGISLDNIITMIVNYVITILLYICSFLAVFNNNKIDPEGVYKYLMILSVFLILLVTVVTVSKIL